MQDERNTPQEDDAEEVEGHARSHSRDDEDMNEGSEDEVEAHARRPAAPSESRMPNPSE